MRNKIASIMSVVLFLVFCQLANAASYYVDSNLGNDSNNGTSTSKPWKTLSKINSRDFSPGDYIYLATGSEWAESLNIENENGTAANPITVTDYDSGTSGRPHITGGVVLSGSQGIKVSNLELTKIGLKFNYWAQGAGREYSHLTFDNLYIHGSAGDLCSGGINSFPGGTSYLTDVTISNCRLEYIDSYGVIQVNGWGWDDAHDNYFSSAITITDNVVKHVTGAGIQVGKTMNTYIARNYTYDTGNNLSFGGDGLWTWHCIDLLAEYNVFRGSDGHEDGCGVHLDMGCSNNILQYNLSIENRGGFAEILGNCFNNTYRYNISVNDGERSNNGRVFFLSGYREGPSIGAYNNYVYNNTIYQRSDITAIFEVNDNSHHTLFANNIIYMKDCPITNKGSSGGEIHYKNNLIIGPSISATLYDVFENNGTADPQFFNPGGFSTSEDPMTAIAETAALYAPGNFADVIDKGVEIYKVPDDAVGITGGTIGPKTLSGFVVPDILGNDISGIPDIGAIEIQDIPTNLPPTANAGTDQTVTDTDWNGTESVTLDGSGSSDFGGSIVSYVWSEGSTQIATGVNPSVDLALGSNTITLTVTDNDGLTDSDTVNIEVEEPSASLLYTFDDGAGNPDWQGWTVTSQNDTGTGPKIMASSVSERDNLTDTPVVSTRSDVDGGGFKGDEAHPILIARSPSFLITKSDPITFESEGGKISASVAPALGTGAYNANALGVSLVNEATGERVLSVKTAQENSRGEYSLDASAYLNDGQSYYLEVVDNLSGSWGYVEWDTFDVPQSITPPNQAPVAQDQNVVTDEDIAKAITLIATDDDGDSLTYSVVAQPANGALSGTAPNLTYTPNAEFFGTDSFTFKANDGTEDSNIATVSITITAVNDLPTANAGADQAVTDADGSGSESVTLDGSGSSDPDGTIASYVWKEGAIEIATGVNPSVALAIGQHTITLTVTDDDGGADSDTVTITVNAGGVIEPGTYHIENKLHDPARLKNDGTTLPKIVATSDDSNATIWAITETAPGSGLYYIDNGDMRLSDGDGSDDPVLVSTSTTTDNVKWTIVESATANEYWITTIAGNSQPRMRSDGTSVPDMQKTSAAANWTRWELVPAVIVIPPEVQFASSSSSVDEPAGSASITVALSKTSGSDVVVDCNVSAGTATDSEDYILASGVATVPAGQLTASIDLTIVDDFIMEDDETVTVSLANSSGATLGSTLDHTVTITDDDGNFEAGTVQAFSNWTQVALVNEYVYAPVIACVVNYDSNTVPVVARLRNVTTDSFEIMLQNPGGAGAVAADEVHFIAMEEGAWTLADGTKIEAQLVASDGTSGKSDWSTGQMEQLTYLHTYSSAPVVLGQVMSYNDPLWSTFWTCGDSRLDPATATTCYVGKHVAEDSITARANETLGVIVVEGNANGSLGNVAFQSGVGADTVKGIDDAPAYSYALQAGVFGAAPEVGVATMQAMDGANGGWGYLYGANPLSSDAVNLAVDEDQVVDSERKHTDEQMSYMIIESKSVSRMTLAE